MAETNIGGITFGINAQIDQLNKVINRLPKLRAEVDKTAKSQVEGAQASARALFKQEQALERAINQTKKLQQAAAASGNKKQVQATQEVINGLSRLSASLTKGELSTIKFGRAQTDFARSLDKSKRAINNLNKATSGKGIGKTADLLRNLESSAVLALGPLSGLGARIRSVGAIAARTNGFLLAMFVGLTAVGVGLFKLSGAALNAGKVFESSLARFQAASGSISIARKEMDFVIRTAQNLGLRIDVTAKAFSRLTAAAAGTNIQGEGIRKIFLGVSKAAAALRLEQGEVTGAFRAIEQIMSKGTVQAEELRGQLGERIPGAFRLAAKAVGLTTKALGESLRAGEQISEEFLPAFVKELESAFGATAQDNVNSFTGSVNNLANASLLFGQAFNKATGISKIFVGVVQAITSGLKAITKVVEDSTAAVGAFAIVAAVTYGPQFLNAIVKIARALKALELVQKAVNAAMLANPAGTVIRTIVKIAAAVTLFVASFKIIKGSIDKTSESAEEFDKKLNDIVKNDLIDPTSDFSRGFKALAAGIDKTIAKTNALKEALAFGNRIDDIARLGELFTIELGFKGEDPDDIAFKVRELNKVLNQNQPEKPLGLATLFLIAREELEKLIKTMDNLKNKPKNLQAVFDKIQAIKDETASVLAGGDTPELFKAVTVPVNAITAALREQGIVGAELTNIENKLVEALENLFIANKNAAIAKKADAEATRALKKEETNRIRVLKRQNAALDKARVATEQLRLRVAALAKGPDSLEIFEKVQAPLAAYIQRLKDAEVPLEEHAGLIAEQNELLQKQAILQGRLADAAAVAADSIGNALERIILKTQTLSEALKNLARDLLRLFLRAQFLDPLVNSLTGGFTKLFTKNALAAIPTGGGGAGGGAVPGLSGARAGGGPAAAGGAFLVGEEGPEILRMGSRSGTVTPNSALGGVNITINAPGADAGTIARLKEIVRVELAPQIISAATSSTLSRFRRPGFA